MQQPDYRIRCLCCREWMRFNPSASAPKQRMDPPHSAICTDCHQTPEGQSHCGTCNLRKSLEKSCCRDWWEGLTEAQRKYAHWYFRDMQRLPDMSFHYSISDHLAAVRDFEPPELPAPLLIDEAASFLPRGSYKILEELLLRNSHEVEVHQRQHLGINLRCDHPDCYCQSAMNGGSNKEPAVESRLYHDRLAIDYQLLLPELVYYNHQDGSNVGN